MTEHKCPICGVTLTKEGEWYYCRTVECVTLEVHETDLFMIDALIARLKTSEDEKKIEFAEAVILEMNETQLIVNRAKDDYPLIRHIASKFFIRVNNLTSIFIPKEESDANDK